MKGHALILIALLSCSLWFAACAQGEEEPFAEEMPPAEPLEEKPMPGDMVMIPAGEFTMGSDEKAGSPPIASPAHTVDVPAYEIDVYEVTNGEFARFQIESDYSAEGDWRSFYTIGKEDFPVANVTLDDAKAYCEWAGKRLPSEAEWEKAARGPEGKAYPWGDVFDWTKSNTIEAGARNTVEVGSVAGDVSDYGVRDMMGNVMEWTSDTLKPYKGNTVKGFVGFNGNYVATRGASYTMKGASMFLWSRAGYVAKSQYGHGFRCVRDVETEEPAEEASGSQ
jgi:formylglycine-generating enzyme required for sulfatase activity